MIAIEKQSDPLADVNDLLNAAQQRAEMNGFILSPYDKDEFTGFQATKTVKIEDLQKAGSEMLGFPQLPSIISKFNWYYEPSIFRNGYHMRMAIDLRNITDEAAIDSLPSDLRKRARQAIESSVVEVHITLPGQPDRTNAETKPINGKDATLYSWNLKPGESKSLEINAILEKNNTRKRVTWAVAAFTVLILTALLYLVHKSRKK